MTYRIPLGHLALLLKSGKLPPVVNDGEEFPKKEQSKTNGYDSSDDTQDNSKDVENRWALFGLLNTDDKLVLFVITINEGNPTVVIIVEPTLPIRWVFLCNPIILKLVYQFYKDFK